MNEAVKTIDSASGEIVRFGGPAPVASTPITPMAMLSQAVANGASIEVLTKLMDLRDRWEATEARKSFNIAMAAAQAEMRPVAKNLYNSQTKSRYASHDALDDAIRPIYTKHGFVVSFMPGEGAPQDHIRVVCTVSRDGYERECHLDLPADGKGAKGGDVMTRTHATGSAIKYGMRYLLSMIFNIATTDRAIDDDGNSAGSGSVSDAQAEQITKLALEVKADVPKLLEFFKAESISDIRCKDFDRAMTMLNAKRAKGHEQ